MDSLFRHASALLAALLFSAFSSSLRAQESAPASQPAAAEPEPAAPQPEAAMKLWDLQFAKRVCESVNRTPLKKGLGRSGTGWIDSMDKKGHQVMVIGRRDCKGWTPIRTVWEADAEGNALCKEATYFKKGDEYNWRFAPTTLHWADFSDGFGVFDMPKIMPGFEGSYPTAMKNMGNFVVFFSAVGYVALKNNIDWTCDGGETAKIQKEVSKIDRKDMEKNLKGAELLQP